MIINTTSSELVNNSSTIEDDLIDYQKISSSIGLILCILAVISILLDAYILTSSAWLRRPLSINLLLSLSLAAADFFSGLLIILQLLLNRPDIYDYLQPHNCLILSVEILRLSSFSISVLHLLALAGNHFVGIVFPIHQRTWNTKMVKIGIVGFVWGLPPAILFVVTFSIPDQGFRSRDCENLSFVQQSFMFRNLISILIFVPMFTTIGIYVATVVYLRKTKNDPLLAASTKRPRKGDLTINQQKKTNNKLFWTMILLMGTFILGWMPSVLIYLLICETCPLAMAPDTWLFFALVTCTFTLTIVKLCCNAFIYALRVTELRRALKLMHAACLWTLFRYEACRDKPSLQAMVAYKAVQNCSLLRPQHRYAVIKHRDVQPKPARGRIEEINDGDLSLPNEKIEWSRTGTIIDENSTNDIQREIDSNNDDDRTSMNKFGALQDGASGHCAQNLSFTNLCRSIADILVEGSSAKETFL